VILRLEVEEEEEDEGLLVPLLLDSLVEESSTLGL
jgi:hypothetical protein